MSKKEHRKGFSLFYVLAAMIAAAIAASGFLFAFLVQLRSERLYSREVDNKMAMLADSVRTRIASSVVIDDYANVDAIVSKAFRFDGLTKDVFVVREKDGIVYYDLSKKMEGKPFEQIQINPKAKRIVKPIILSGGMGFIVPAGAPIAKIVVDYRSLGPTADMQMKALVDYARSLLDDISGKLNENQADAVRLIISNMFSNSDKIVYVQWINMDGIVLANLSPDERGHLLPEIEGRKLDDEIGRRALTVTPGKPLLIQDAAYANGRPVYDIAMPLLHKGEKVGTLRLGYSISDFQDAKRHSWLLFFIALAIFTFTGVCSAAMASSWISRPLMRLAQAAQKAGTGDLDQEIAIRGGGREVMRLGADLNDMIRQRKKAEEAARNAADRWQATFNAISEPLCLLNLDGGVEICNNAMEKFLQAPQSAIIGKKYYELTHGASEPVANCPVERMKQSGCREVSLLDIGETAFRVVAEPFRNEKNELSGAVYMLEDVTSQRQFEENLRFSEEKFSKAFHSSPNLMVLFDLESWRRIDVNESYVRITGYSREEIIGGDFDILNIQVDPEKASEGLRFLEEKGTVRDVELDIRTKDGGRRTLLYAGEVAEVGGRRLAIISGEDITERKQAEEENKALQDQLLQAQKMEAVGQLAGGVAHDFNNMLAAIMGNAEVGLFDLKDGDPAYPELQEILRASRRAKDLTMKMLTYARKNALSLEIVSINGIIEEVTQMLEPGFLRKIAIVKSLQEDLWPIRADANQIYQALLNICANALDAMPEGGRLTIETKQMLLDEAFCRMRPGLQPGEHCFVQISDTGIGMPEEILKRIFEPFFTTKEIGKGTGLGLSVAFGIIQKHRGSILAHSEPGRGATFEIYLPAVEATATIPEQKPAREIAGGPETILIVDDERIVLKLSKRILEMAGYNTLIADRGAEAVKIYQNQFSKIDLVLLDILMPDMDGRSVYKVMKAINPAVKVVLVSGYSYDEVAAELMGDGIRHYIQKPFDVEELCGAIRKALDD